MAFQSDIAAIKRLFDLVVVIDSEGKLCTEPTAVAPIGFDASRFVIAYSTPLSAATPLGVQLVFTVMFPPAVKVAVQISALPELIACASTRFVQVSAGVLLGTVGEGIDASSGWANVSTKSAPAGTLLRVFVILPDSVLAVCTPPKITGALPLPPEGAAFTVTCTSSVAVAPPLSVTVSLKTYTPWESPVTVVEAEAGDVMVPPVPLSFDQE
jgi:hypothetical protein